MDFEMPGAWALQKASKHIWESNLMIVLNTCLLWQPVSCSGEINFLNYLLLLLLFSHSVVSDSLWSCGLQHARPPCPSLSPRVFSTHVYWVDDDNHHLILCCPLLLRPSIFPSIRIFSNESDQMDKVLELQLQHQSFQWIFRVDFL